MEELLAQSYDATQGASQIFTMFNNADVKFPVITGENGEGIRVLVPASPAMDRRDAFW